MTSPKQPTRPGGGSQPDTLGVRLVWWPLPTTQADKAWDGKPPHCREVEIEMLGVWSPRRSYFTVHAVLPKETLPKMNSSARTQFIKAARTSLSEQIGIPVHGVTQDVVDWGKVFSDGAK